MKIPMRKTLLALLALGIVVALHGGVLPGATAQTDNAAAETAAPADEAATDGATDDQGQGEHGEDGQHGEVDHGEEDHGEEGHGEAGHTSPALPVLLGLVVMLAGAKIGGAVFERVGQPAVLGELIVGVLFGNLTLLGFDGLGFLTTNTGIEILAEIGVVLLLFEVGLESNLSEMMSVGFSSLAVALLGIVAPFFLGWGTSAWFLPDESILVHLFIGATLCATSVGITARVLTDLDKIQARESKIILGAAVIDDVLGLVILAVVSGVITAANTGGSLETIQILWIIGKAVLFLGGAVLIGSALSPWMFTLASRLRIQGALLATALSFCFLLSYLANAIGLATIVGAFAAGLVLDRVHYKEFLDRGEHTIEELIHPIAAFLVPVFFIRMGAAVDLSTFGTVSVLGFAAVLSLAAIVGKGICAAGVLERGLDRISVAVGMIPRGEVGLIFAAIGASLVLDGHPVVNDEVYSAVVIMVIVTTLITPPLLKYTLARGDAKKAAHREAEAG